MVNKIAMCMAIAGICEVEWKVFEYISRSLVCDSHDRSGLPYFSENSPQ